MLDILILIWLIVFIIFFLVSVVQNAGIFGIISGFWLMLFGVMIVATGIQTQSGMTITTVGANQTITYQFADIVSSISSYSFILGFIFIGVSMYIVYAGWESLKIG